MAPNLKNHIPSSSAAKRWPNIGRGILRGAIKWSQAAAQHPFPYAQAEAFAILGMYQYEMKQVDTAKDSIAKCAQVVETRLPKLEAG